MSRTYGKAQDLIDFTRASSGTALRRVKYGAELVTNGTFSDGSTGWNNSPSLPMDTFEISSGRLHIVNAAGTTQVAYTDDSISLVAGRVYTFSAHLEKAGGLDNWDIDIRQGGQSIVRYFITNTATTENIVVNFVATTTENVVIQITARNTFDGYIDNVSVKEVTFDTSDGDLVLFNHPNNIPRIEYDANGNLLGLLVEESRTNLISYSDLSSNWTEFNATKTISSVEAPNGDLMYELNSTATGVPTGTVTTYSSTSGTYTVSAILKAGTTNYAFVGISDNATGQAEIRFNLSGGTYDTTNVGFVGSWTNVSGSIVDLGNGFYRCSTTGTQGAGNPVSSRIIAGAPDGSRSQTVINTKLYATGAQLESGSFMTSLIPTSGSTATRSADVASLSTSAFGFNGEQGSVVVEADSAGSNGSDYPQAFSLDGASTGHAIRAGFNTTNLKQFVVVDSGTNQCILNNGAYSPNDLLKLSIAYKENDFASSSNGDAVATDTSGTVPTVSALSVGKWQNGNHLNGHVKSVKYYPRRLTNDQLVELTS